MITLALLFAALLPQGPVIPAPRGFVNDFAGVIDAASAARIEQLAAFVRAHSGGEIAVVTMKDIGGRDVADIARTIGRDWGVGMKSPVGDRSRNAGVVVLVVPKETAKDGRGRIRIEVGQGAEGFISDGTSGDIQRDAIPYFQRQDYGGALTLITARLAQRYASEFKFSLDSAGATPVRVAPRPANRDDGGFPLGGIIGLIVFIVIFSRIFGGRGRRGGSGLGSALPWIIMSQMGRRGGGSSGGGWGGGGGGGFGGFGGGGGFSGGGSSGSW